MWILSHFGWCVIRVAADAWTVNDIINGLRTSTGVVQRTARHDELLAPLIEDIPAKLNDATIWHSGNKLIVDLCDDVSAHALAYSIPSVRRRKLHAASARPGQEPHSRKLLMTERQFDSCLDSKRLIICKAKPQRRYHLLLSTDSGPVSRKTGAALPRKR